jgi:hypothetical protein
MLTLYQIKGQMLSIAFGPDRFPKYELSEHIDAVVTKVQLPHLNSVLVSEYYDPNPLPRVTFRIGENSFVTFQVHSGWHSLQLRDPDLNLLRLNLGSGLELRVFQKGDPLTEEELNGMEY